MAPFPESARPAVMRAMPTARIASMPFQEKRSPISGMPPLSVLVVVVVPAFVIWKDR